MPNNLITSIQNSLAKMQGSSLDNRNAKNLDKKIFKQLDYELMFKTLEGVVEETMAEYGGAESMEFLRQKYFEKFGHLLKLMSGQKSDE